jgi:ABC-type amino acid transport substrate-binding protein
MLNPNSQILASFSSFVLDESAFSTANRARLSRYYFVPYSDFETSGFSRTKDDEHEDEISISELTPKSVGVLQDSA